jgi:hypothetical protein
VGWCVVGDQVSWFEFDHERAAVSYFEAARHAKESESDRTLKRAWLQRAKGISPLDENSEWVLIDGPLPIPSTFEAA